MKKSAFSLLELLLVLSVAALLIIAVSAAYIKIKQKRDIWEAQKALQATANALHSYWLDQGNQFPITTNLHDLIGSGYLSADYAQSAWGTKVTVKLFNGDSNAAQVIYSDINENACNALNFRMGVRKNCPAGSNGVTNFEICVDNAQNFYDCNPNP